MEVAALGDGGDVGAVVGEDASRTSRASARSSVSVTTWMWFSSRPAGGADVEAAVGGGGGDELDGDVDGVALVAVLGGGVAEPDMLADVVGGEGDVPCPPRWDTVSDPSRWVG